jgi:hypothetical protein
MSGGAIAGIVIGIIAAIVLGVAGYMYFKRQHSEHKGKPLSTFERLDDHDDPEFDQL